MNCVSRVLLLLQALLIFSSSSDSDQAEVLYSTDSIRGGGGGAGMKGFSMSSGVGVMCSLISCIMSLHRSGRWKGCNLRLVGCLLGAGCNLDDRGVLLTMADTGPSLFGKRISISSSSSVSGGSGIVDGHV